MSEKSCANCVGALRRLLTNDNLADGESPYLTPNYIRAGQSGGRFHFCRRLDFSISWIPFTGRTTSADGIQKSEPAPDAREAIPEAGEGFDGTEKEILETMKMYDLCGFDEDEE